MFLELSCCARKQRFHRWSCTYHLVVPQMNLHCQGGLYHARLVGVRFGAPAHAIGRVGCPSSRSGLTLTTATISCCLVKTVRPSRKGGFRSCTRMWTALA